MILHFNVTGDRRRELVKVMERTLGQKGTYLGTPSMAYQIGDYTVSKDGTVTWEDMADSDWEKMKQTNSIIEACKMAGFETENIEKQESETKKLEEGQPVKLIVTMSRAQFTNTQIENLLKLISAKAPLLKIALGIRELPIIITDENLSFPWFEEGMDADSCEACTKLITAICQMAKEAKRVTVKEKEVENEKYAFRCFLLRLGFIGGEYKQIRKILMKNFTGSSAFKSEAQKGKKE